MPQTRRVLIDEPPPPTKPGAPTSGRGAGAGPNQGTPPTGGRSGGPGRVIVEEPPPSQFELGTTLTSALPWLGGAAGGVVGGVGGSIGGLGIGGVPGAVGGATVGGATGESLREIIDSVFLGKPPKASAAEAAKSIATEGAIQGASELVGQGIAKGVSKFVAPKLMRSALKPSKDLAGDVGSDIPKVIQTMLDEKVNVTRGGYEKLDALLKASQQEVKDALASSNATVDALDVARRVTPTTQKFMQQVAPGADLKAIDDTVSDFLAHPQMPASGRLPIQQAQDMKVGTYRVLSGKYGEMGSASTEASKALARGLKEEIEAAVPGIGPLNAREGALITAQQAMRNRLPVAANMNPIGFANAAPDRPFRFLTALIDRSPAVKSMIANGLWVKAGQTAKVNPQMIRAAVAAVLMGRDHEAPKEPR